MAPLAHSVSSAAAPSGALSPVLDLSFSALERGPLIILDNPMLESERRRLVLVEEEELRPSVMSTQRRSGGGKVSVVEYS